MSEHQYTNALINSNNPYLLQHAHNPVNWVEWSEEAFQQAEKEGKLVLISIGYSSCHWCHVMEKESFQDEEIAQLMNDHLVCIKVDREERPDIDHVYMRAVQMMTKGGGWPLNCFALPDKRPIYGGTYYPKKSWIDVIQQLAEKYKNEKNAVLEYAQMLAGEMMHSELIQVQLPKVRFQDKELVETIEKWKRNFDRHEGGNKTVPKFPLPNNYEFLLQYGYQYQDDTVLDHVHLSLEKMALGGIFDQLGGGFSRYSTDRNWKIPHFEKMLYDNGQLLSAFAQAYQHKKRVLYKDTIEKTVGWLYREMHDEKGGFYAALDADTEGVEGKFYTWSANELAEILQDDFGWFADYYNINDYGYWENGQYVLIRQQPDNLWCVEKGVSIQGLEIELQRAHGKLWEARKKRVRPGLDDKKITSWNAMVIQGLADTGMALQNQDYIDKAVETMEWLLNVLYDEKSTTLYRLTKDGKTNVEGFLEDYAHVIQALLTLHSITLEERWTKTAKTLMDKCVNEYFDPQSKMFFFTQDNVELLTRKIEVNDTVIPASNSVMANSLYILSKIYRHEQYEKMAKQMLSNVYHLMPTYGSAYSNWGMLALQFTQSSFEVAITGKKPVSTRFKMGDYYLPNALFSGGTSAFIPFTADKSFDQDALIYVCENFACQAPTKEIGEAVKMITSRKK